MGLLQGPERVEERFSGLKIRVHPLPPTFEGVVASIRRLASPGPLRRNNSSDSSICIEAMSSTTRK